MPFALDPSIDAPELARRFAATGRVTIERFLARGGAELLHENLRSRSDWCQVINSGEKLFELDRNTRRSMSAGRIRSLDQAVYAGARRGFQFRYETIRISDDPKVRSRSKDVLAKYASWLSNGEARDLLREITGDNTIGFADAQATAYSPGDFLTRHDDDVAGKNRSAAYVLSLCPEWRVEWGGLLLMHEAEGHGAAAIIPGFNRLNLFRVPQVHSVSEVSQASPFRRYALTGWLRR